MCLQIRRYIRMRMGLVHYKNVHAAGRGQGTNTRAQDAINGIWAKVKRSAYRYIHTYDALRSLRPEGGSWSRRLRSLDIQTDLRNAAGIDPEDDDLTDQRPAARRARMLGDGHRLVPWIWTVLEHNGSDVVGDDATEEEVVEGKKQSCLAQIKTPVTLPVALRYAFCVLQSPFPYAPMAGGDRAHSRGDEARCGVFRVEEELVVG